MNCFDPIENVIVCAPSSETTQRTWCTKVGSDCDRQSLEQPSPGRGHHSARRLHDDVHIHNGAPLAVSGDPRRPPS